MSYYVHGNGIGEPMLCATEDEALAKMETMMKNLEAQGYTRKPHATQPNRFILTHPTQGYVDVYVDVEP